MIGVATQTDTNHKPPTTKTQMIATATITGALFYPLAPPSPLILRSSSSSSDPTVNPVVDEVVSAPPPNHRCLRTASALTTGPGCTPSYERSSPLLWHHRCLYHCLRGPSSLPLPNCRCMIPPHCIHPPRLMTTAGKASGSFGVGGRYE